MPDTLVRPPSARELNKLVTGRTDEVEVWCAPLAGLPDAETEREVAERVKVRFRVRGELAHNAHAVEWDVDEPADDVYGIGAWRSQFGGEKLTHALVERRLEVGEDEIISMPAEGMTMLAEKLQL